MWRNTVAIYSVSEILNQLSIKKIKSTKTILKKKKQKENEKQMGKKHVGKVKVKFSISSILYKKKSTDNLKKKHVGKHCSKTKTI